MTYALVCLYQLAGRESHHRRSFGVTADFHTASKAADSLNGLVDLLPIGNSAIRGPHFELEKLTFAADGKVVVPTEVALYDASQWLLDLVAPQLDNLSRPPQWDDESDDADYLLIDGKAVVDEDDAT